MVINDCRPHRKRLWELGGSDGCSFAKNANVNQNKHTVLSSIYGDRKHVRNSQEYNKKKSTMWGTYRTNNLFFSAKKFQGNMRFGVGESTY